MGNTCVSGKSAVPIWVKLVCCSNLGKTCISGKSAVLILVKLVFQATVLEEMPPFPERESSILAKLKKKKPTVAESAENKEHKMPAVQVSGGSDGPALQVSTVGETSEN